MTQAARSAPGPPRSDGVFLSGNVIAKVDGEWCFTERVEGMELIGDLSEHLLRDFAP